MPRGYKGTKKPRGWKVGQRIEIHPTRLTPESPLGDRIILEEHPLEEYKLPVKATIVEPGLEFDSLVIGWVISARIDGSSRDGRFELKGINRL